MVAAAAVASSLGHERLSMGDESDESVVMQIVQVDIDIGPTHSPHRGPQPAHHSQAIGPLQPLPLHL